MKNSLLLRQISSATTRIVIHSKSKSTPNKTLLKYISCTFKLQVFHRRYKDEYHIRLVVKIRAHVLNRKKEWKEEQDCHKVSFFFLKYQKRWLVLYKALIMVGVNRGILISSDPSVDAEIELVLREIV